MILSLKIPPHLKCVATLPCEMSVCSRQQLKTRRLLQQHILRVHRTTARRTQWAFDVKLQAVTVTSDNKWDDKHVSCCWFLKMCCYRSLVFNCCFKTSTFHKVV